MRYVTFQLAENDYHVGLIKDDKIIDITHWMSITQGTLSQTIEDDWSDSPRKLAAWKKRRQRRNDMLMSYFQNGAHGHELAVQAQDWLRREFKREVELDEVFEQGMMLAIEFADPFGMVDLIQNDLDFPSMLGEESDEDLVEDDLLLALTDALLVSPIPRPPKHVLCLGRNYAEHAAESTRAFGEAAPPVEKPAYPAIFTKAPTAITGPYADIPYDSDVSTQIDWEGELAIVIGKGGKNISREDAMQHVFGYTVLNDISARDIQKRHGGQFFKGKSLDGSCPVGPWIVTADEIPDPHNLQLTTRVNGIVKQNASTGTMLFNIPEIIEQLSLGMTLEPGDIIATGTPAGVGHARTPPEFLRPGDLVEVDIEKIGTIRNHIAEA
jgi:2-keto-4-pentenoate hydratase/2-oxohepta-3-ene-1,7-dioic acid hydratase in catechol pathway